MNRTDRHESTHALINQTHRHELLTHWLSNHMDRHESLHPWIKQTWIISHMNQTNMNHHTH